MTLPFYIKERGKIVLGSEDSPYGFCKVLVPKYLEGNVDNLPFAEIQGKLGNARNEGSGEQVNIGDHVWVELHRTEARPVTMRVIVVGSAYSAPDGLPNMPHDGFNGPLTLNQRHQIPRDKNGDIHEDFEEPKRYVKGRSIPIIVKEGISFVIQNGQLALTHLKTFSHLFFSESGIIDLYSSRNLFLRAKQNLYILANKISFKSKKLVVDLDDLEFELKKFGIDAKTFVEIKSSGVIGLIGAALKLVAQGDIVVSTQGKLSQEANGSALTNINQDLTVEKVRAFGAQLMVAGAPIAELGIEAALGKIIAENLNGSVKGQLDDIVDRINKVIDIMNEAIFDAGTGESIMSPKTKRKLMEQKPELAKIKLLNSLILK